MCSTPRGVSRSPHTSPVGDLEDVKALKILPFKHFKALKILPTVPHNTKRWSQKSSGSALITPHLRVSKHPLHWCHCQLADHETHLLPQTPTQVVTVWAEAPLKKDNLVNLVANLDYCYSFVTVFPWCLLLIASSWFPGAGNLLPLEMLWGDVDGSGEHLLLLHVPLHPPRMLQPGWLC